MLWNKGDLEKKAWLSQLPTISQRTVSAPVQHPKIILIIENDIKHTGKLLLLNCIAMVELYLPSLKQPYTQLKKIHLIGRENEKKNYLLTIAF